jgi:MSHA biogenesis protein MshO
MIRRSGGFTLIEMIMVIVIGGVIAGMVALSIKAPVEGYFSSVRRAALSEEADSALRFLARDLQSALPNSIACSDSGSGGKIEFLSIRSGGRFREATTSSGSGRPLSFATASTGFDTIGGGADSALLDARGVAVAGLSGRVVVGNLSSGVANCHADYANVATAGNAATLAGLGAGSVSIASATYPAECALASASVDDDAATADLNEANNREFGRFYVVDPQPVSYDCYTDSSHGLTRNGSALVAANHVAGCHLACDGSKARVQLISVNLTLKDRDNDPVSLLRRVTIVNRP